MSAIPRFHLKPQQNYELCVFFPEFRLNEGNYFIKISNAYPDSNVPSYEYVTTYIASRSNCSWSNTNDFEFNFSWLNWTLCPQYTTEELLSRPESNAVHIAEVEGPTNEGPLPLPLELIVTADQSSPALLDIVVYPNTVRWSPATMRRVTRTPQPVFDSFSEPSQISV